MTPADSRTNRRRSTWARHLRWAVPLLIAAAALFLLPWAGDELTPDKQTDIGAALLFLGTVVAALVITAVGVIVALVNGIRALRHWRTRRRHAAGNYTPAELAARDQQQQVDDWWRYTVQLLRQLRDHEVPDPIAVWDVVPVDGEVFFLDTTANYARHYGQNVAYSQTGGFFFGHPLFVTAGLALTAAGNASRRAQADAAAQAQWREHQPVRLLVSNRRLLCLVQGQWLSFFYPGMTAIYPEVDHWTLICQFGDTSPLLLHGPSAPPAAVITLLMTFGPNALEHHPGLAHLRATIGSHTP